MNGIPAGNGNPAIFPTALAPCVCVCARVRARARVRVDVCVYRPGEIRHRCSEFETLVLR